MDKTSIRNDELALQNLNDDNDPIAESFKSYVELLQDQNPNRTGSHAHIWYYNVACFCARAIKSNFNMSDEEIKKISNTAAREFMKHYFNVELNIADSSNK